MRGKKGQIKSRRGSESQTLNSAICRCHLPVHRSLFAVHLLRLTFHLSSPPTRRYAEPPARLQSRPCVCAGRKVSAHQFESRVAAQNLRSRSTIFDLSLDPITPTRRSVSPARRSVSPGRRSADTPIRRPISPGLDTDTVELSEGISPLISAASSGSGPRSIRPLSRIVD
jgi:hypothetical protein